MSPKFLGVRVLLLLLVAFWSSGVSRALADQPPRVQLQSNDVVAFVGGTDVTAAQFAGHLETVLAVMHPGVRFRNFGWEGDTVFVRPREINFPPLGEHLKRVGATVVFLQFGRTEVLSGGRSDAEFIAAYEKLLDECAKQTPRLVLMTPPPFESAREPLPDLSVLNERLNQQAEAIRALAHRRQLPLVDLFLELRRGWFQQRRLTDNGQQLSAAGQAVVAAAFASQLGFDKPLARAGDIHPDGTWSNQSYENLRAVVVQKNRLWFDYWRPQNWAFLGGDRTTQMSSRDHRDPKVRWFPAEMEKFKPLIAEKEQEMERLAAELRGGVK